MTPFSTLTCSALLAVITAVVSPAAEATADGFGGRYRLSALIDTPNGVRVGLIDTQTRESFLVSPGQTAGDLFVIAADYAGEKVNVRRGHQVGVLLLRQADSNEVNRIPPGRSPDTVYRGAAIEDFLRKNPDALERSRVKFTASPKTAATGAGESLEEYLRKNPDIARKIDQPAEGYGEGIHAYLNAHPEVKIFEGPIPEGSLGPGIDAALRASETNLPGGRGSAYPPAAPNPSAQAEP